MKKIIILSVFALIVTSCNVSRWMAFGHGRSTLILTEEAYVKEKETLINKYFDFTEEQKAANNRIFTEQIKEAKTIQLSDDAQLAKLLYKYEMKFRDNLKPSQIDQYKIAIEKASSDLNKYFVSDFELDGIKRKYID